MGLTLILGRNAGIKIQEIGGLALIAFADTQVFLDACVAAGVLILGVEGFYLNNAQVRPEMGAIADFSQIKDSKDSVLEARSFIEAAGRPDMFFDFTLSKEAMV